MKELIINEIEKSIEVKTNVLNDNKIIEQLSSLVNNCIQSLNSGGKIIFCGNGGSFADSQHLAAEFISRLRFDRAPLASIALGTNSSNMSAIGNDYGYDQVFKREILALGNSNDIFIPISTSGNSSNVIDAINAAKEKGIKTVAFTGGTGGKLSNICECIIVPSSSTEKIQEVHIMLGHILCYLIEAQLFNKKNQ
jgi:D-sedoheptulose 7-phosphate isomerase